MFYDAVLRNRKMSKYCYLCGKVEQLDVFGSPKDPSIRAKWFAFCNVDEEYHSTMQTLRLCEKHFKEEEICRKKTPNGRSKLKKFVEPSQTRERLRKEAKVTNTLGHCQICTRSGLLKSERSYSSKISNFCFPKDAALREKWLHFCELEEEELPSDPRLCSLHFHPDEIVKHSPLKWGLATGAVPILYDIEGAADFSDTCAIEQSLESVEHEVVQSTDLISESGVEEMIEIVENCDGSSSCSAQSDMEDLIEIVRDDNTSTDYLADSILDNEPVTSPFCFSETCIRDAISVLFVLYYIWCLMISTGCSKTSFVNE